jgi:acyl phosphate:glycerol-3-phosphate acyltransferase
MISPDIWPQSITALLVAAAFGYVVGSVPFGLILTRFAGLGDIRTIGSRNIGATNVLRTGRRDIAALTLLLDMAKGTAAVVLAASWWNDGFLAAAAGAGAFLGHIFPAWIGFRGGKGVATYLGVLVGLHWLSALVFVITWLGVAVVLRYSSLAALTASVAGPISLLIMGYPVWAMVMAVLTAVLWVRHIGNIRRLIAGEEGRIGSRA